MPSSCGDDRCSKTAAASLTLDNATADSWRLSPRAHFETRLSPDALLLLSFPMCERDVNKPNLIRTLWAMPLLLGLAGCANAAKDFGGVWRPVNHFHDEPTEIPLARTYSFYASPMDGTLKTLLTRWSKDTGMVLSYQLTSDFTLYQPVSKIQTNDVRSAAAELSTIYAAEGVLVSINDKQILVSTAAAAIPGASESQPSPGAAAPAAAPAAAATSARSATATPVTPATSAISAAPAAPGTPAISASSTPAARATPATPPAPAASATSATSAAVSVVPSTPADIRP